MADGTGTRSDWQPASEEGAHFAVRAAELRAAGRGDEAMRVLADGLGREPACAEAVVVMALLLLDEEPPEHARHALEQWIAAHLKSAPAPIDGVDAVDDVFGETVSEGELEVAFEAAETDRDQIIDADEIAQQAMRQTGMDLAEELAEADESFRTRTVADLLERQGDERGASRIRELVNAPTTNTAGRSSTRGREGKIRQLERWLGNLRGGVQ